MKKLNLTTVLAAIIVLAMGLGGQVQAQFQSDFQIKQNFDRDHARLLDELKMVSSVPDAAALVDQVNRMEAQYRDHQLLLDRVLYPETLVQRVRNLRELANATRMHLERIGQKGDTIVILEQRIAELTDDAERYQALADSLRRELEAMRRSRDANAAQARRLRQELDQRDAFIIKMIDSTFVAYQNVNLQSLSRAERRDLALEIDAQNVFGFIETVIDNNLAFLDTHTQLSTVDFLKLYSVQTEFDRMWSNMGRDLAEMYVAETDRQDRLATIENKINEWEMLIDDAAWSALASSFDAAGINLSSFSNSLQFYTALNSYLDTAIARAQEGGSEEELAAYQQFADLWFNDVKPSWQEYLVDANLMTYDNFNTIDQKLADWKLNAQPTSNLMAILLGLAVIVALIFLGLWIKSRSGSSSSKA
jgi:hypothetical protein